MRSAPSAAYIEQTAGRSAARAARRRALRYDKNGMRPPKRTYVLLSLVIVASLAPLYYALLLASSTAADIAQNPIPSLLPQGHLLDNFKRVVSADVDLLHAAWNSVVVSTGTAVAVVLLSVLAGFAFARLRFRGRSVLLLFVVGTMAVPTQLGVVPLFMGSSQLTV